MALDNTTDTDTTAETTDTPPAVEQAPPPDRPGAVGVPSRADSRAVAAGDASSEQAGDQPAADTGVEQATATGPVAVDQLGGQDSQPEWETAEDPDLQAEPGGDGAGAMATDIQQGTAGPQPADGDQPEAQPTTPIEPVTGGQPDAADDGQPAETAAPRDADADIAAQPTDLSPVLPHDGPAYDQRTGDAGGDAAGKDSRPTTDTDQEGVPVSEEAGSADTAEPANDATGVRHDVTASERDGTAKDADDDVEDETQPAEPPTGNGRPAPDGQAGAAGDGRGCGEPGGAAGRADARRPPEDAGQDESGSWRGEGGQYLNAEENLATGHALDRIRDHEPRVTADLSAIERELPNGELAGIEYRLKSEDRFKEKVATEARDNPELSVGRISEAMPDAVRYTFRFDKNDYARGYGQVRQRLEDRGYTMVLSRNSWDSPDYKGVNTRWRTPEGQLVEVQFHTSESFAAKQETHGAYEKIRSPGTSDRERRELETYQQEVSARIPAPDAVNTIPDYREERY